MKHFTYTLGLLVAGLVAMTALPVSAQTVKLATVDMNRVFEEYYKTPIKRADLDATKESYQKEMDAMVRDMQERQDKLAKMRDELDRPEYSAEVREQKRKELQEKLAEFKKRDMDLQDYRRTHTRLLETKTQDMRQDLLKDISAVVNTMASEAGYTLVLDKSGNTMNLIPTVLFSQGSLEITDAVIKKLNAGKPAPESK